MIPEGLKYKVLCGRFAVVEAIVRVATEIGRDYVGKDVTLITLLKGGTFFSNHLATAIESEGRVAVCRMEYVRVSSYGDAQTPGVVKFELDLQRSVAGTDVIIVDDVADTCRTLEAITNHVRAQKPTSLHVAVLLEKPEKRDPETRVAIDYAAFRIKDAGWVIGCGMDHEGTLRGWPEILQLPQ